MPFSENALFILEKFYYKKDREGHLLEKTPEELFERVANFVSSAERTEELKQKYKNLFFNLMVEQKFMFSSPTLFNAGSDFPLSSSCFVGGLEDDMKAIMKAAMDTAITFKAGAGMGLNFGVLRPKGFPVGRGGTSSGPVSFMHLFDEVGETVKSGGVRRAAFMAMMNVYHPDIEEFITSKDFIENIKRENSLDLPDDFIDRMMGELNYLVNEFVSDENIKNLILSDLRRKVFEPLSNMNISVAITDEFMNAVKNDLDFALRWNGKEIKKLKARELFDRIATSAWRTADPGVWFIDRANEFDTVPSLGRISSTNPCGEQSLHNYTSCNLGSINLVKFVKKNGDFDIEGFKEVVRLAVRGLDNVIDVSAFPTEEFEINTKKIRPIGLGFTGLAETLFKLRIAYNSSEGMEFASEVSKAMTQTAIYESIEIAKEKRSFPLFEENKEALINVVKLYFDNEDEKKEVENLIEKYGIRNSNWTTLAPTGTISLILDAYTYSLEPQFSLAYNKNLIDGGSLIFVDPEFRKAVKNEDEIIKKVIENGGSCQSIKELPEELRRVFVVAHDLDYKDRIKMQSAIQKYISNSISSTINLPNSTTVDEIKEIYFYAWERGLKGVTIYRDGCKSFQPMTSIKKTGKGIKVSRECVKWERPKALGGEIIKTKTGSGTLYTSIGFDENGLPIEIFINISKHGSEISAFSEALGRVISIALQSGVSVSRIADTLVGITGDSTTWDNGRLIKSVPDAVGKILRDYARKLEDKLKSPSLFREGYEKKSMDELNKTEIEGALICPNCGEKAFIKTEDCYSCLYCGFSKCG
ncbi:MAG: adenosylcobalamin-dependent ribonucleoside-diphosphate reductase [Brevinematia bacterium]